MRLARAVTQPARASLLLALTTACTAPGASPWPASPAKPAASAKPVSLAADAQMVTLPPGAFIAGSTPEEREAAYTDFADTAGATTARDKAWFEHEEPRHAVVLPAFRIDRTPVTMRAYTEFVAAGGAPAPAIDEAAWTAQGFAQPYAAQVARYVWRDGHPPAGRDEQPVVLVTQAEAAKYCAWRAEGRRLPTAIEYEAAARGADGTIYPWGDAFDASKLNSGVRGPRDLEAVSAHADGASGAGVLGLAGNVFQWTSTPWPGDATKRTVKGSSWEDYGGVGRGASAHGRAIEARHVIVGFRCAADSP